MSVDVGIHSANFHRSSFTWTSGVVASTEMLCYVVMVSSGVVASCRTLSSSRMHLHGAVGGAGMQHIYIYKWHPAEVTFGSVP